MKPSSVPWLAYASLTASMVLVGSYVALSRPLVDALPVAVLSWLRFAIGAIAMLGWIRRPTDEAPWPRSLWPLLLLCSLFGNVLFSLCMLYGVRLSSASTAGVVMATLPAAVALLGWCWWRSVPTRRQQWAIVLAVAGIALLSLSPAHPTVPETGGGSPLRSPWGTFWLTLAVGCEASYVVIGKRLTQHLGARRIAALINAWGLLLMSPLALASLDSTDWTRMVPSLWALLLFYGLSASMWSVWLWMKGLERIPAAQAGVFTVMLPVTATAVGVWALNEALSLWQLVALLLALGGLLLGTWPERSGAPKTGRLGQPQPKGPA